MFSKRAVSCSFSRFSSTYDEYAEAQAIAASMLVSMIKENLSAIPDGPVLEIGCGTGFVSRQLIPAFPDHMFLITDISGSMADTCRAHLMELGLDCSACLFAAYDGESAWPENSFAMIFSGFTFQWFSDIRDSLTRLIKALKPGGILAFSVQTDGSFKEWKEACLGMQIPFTANPLPAFDQVFSILSVPGAELKAWEEQVIVKYSTSADFFRALKKIGAGTKTSGDHLSPSMMKRLIKGWDAAVGQNVCVTYSAGLFFLRKDQAMIL